MNDPARSSSAAAAWWGPIDRLILHAASEVRVLAALTPVEAQGERARLITQLRRGERGLPRWTYAPMPAAHDELRRALDAAEDWIAGAAETPAHALYLDRVRELSLEAALSACAGTAEVAPLARARFEPRDTPLVSAAAVATALCAAWLAEPPEEPPGDGVASDAPDPRSLLSRMQAEVGRLRLPFAVVATPWLAPLAATGERVILVTTGRLVADEDARRTVLHEIEGHARPRARAAQASSALFRAGTARGIDDQEGRALLLEERAGFLGPRRRRVLAARHRAVAAMLGGADFADVTDALTGEHGLDAAEAVIIAERAFRGGDGTYPGLGRERVYLESFARVRAHLAAHPDDERVLASGQVALEGIDALRDATG